MHERVDHDPSTSVLNLVKHYRKSVSAVILSRAGNILKPLFCRKNVLKIQIMCVVRVCVLVSRICVAEDEESAALWNGWDLLLEAKV